MGLVRVPDGIRVGSIYCPDWGRPTRHWTGYSESGREGESLTTPSESVLFRPETVVVAMPLMASRGRGFKSCPRNK